MNKKENAAEAVKHDRNLAVDPAKEVNHYN